MSSDEKEINKKISSFGQRLKTVFDNAPNKLISTKLNISKSTITEYIQGRIPTSEKIIEIGRLTECNLNWLLTGKGSRFITSRRELPQGLILQGSKGGCGTSTSATIIASNLALRGFKVLLTDANQDHTKWDILFGTDYLEAKKKLQYIESEKAEQELYLHTKNKNIDFFIPSKWTYPKFQEHLVKPFNFDISQINQKYDFVIFDIDKNETPFFYPYYAFPINFSLEPILRNAKVLIPFQPFVSMIRNVERTINNIELERRIYPEAELLGIFFIYLRKLYKSEKPKLNDEIGKLKIVHGSNLFETSINFHPVLQKNSNRLEKILFSRKTDIYANFSMLVDEILQKMKYPITPEKK